MTEMGPPDETRTTRAMPMTIEYRYRDSNPGFRAENWLWNVVCG
jgi:hypothetical protein